MTDIQFEDYVLKCPNTHWFGEGGKTDIQNLLLQCFINNQFGRKPEFFKDMWNLEKHKLKENGYRYYWPNDLTIEYSMKDIDDHNTRVLKAIIKSNGFPTFEQLEEITLKGLFLTMYYSNNAELLELYNEKFLDYANIDKSIVKYYAFLSDKLLYLKGKQQKYGTFFIVDYEGAKTPYMIDNKANLDKRRAELGLMSYDEWKKTDEYRTIGENMYIREAWYRLGNRKLK